MRVQKSDAYGSFTAWGIGFCYEYNTNSKSLSIIHTRRYKPLIDIDISLTALKYPVEFVKLLERTTQVQALMLSNNSTADMTEVFGAKKLRSYLEHTLATALMALMLQKEQFSSFEKIFCDRYDLHGFEIKQSEKLRTSGRFYLTQLETLKRNKVHAQAFYLHNSLFVISNKIISDLIIQETVNNFQPDAHRLLNASSKLSTLSLILNQNFATRRKIVRRRNINTPSERKKA